LPEGKQLTIDFAKLKSDGNTNAGRQELKAFCRKNGFGPVVALVEQPSNDDLRLADLFLKALDINGDGKLSGLELQHCAEALRKYDLNEDDFLDFAELLSASTDSSRPRETHVSLEKENAEKDAILRLNLGAKAQAATLDG
jgi:hypothetical protein